MANNNIEQYLEAMLAALDGDTVPDVPSPSWNIEKYLAAILTKLSSGGSSGGGVLVVHMDDDGVLDKTWSEIDAADVAVIVASVSRDGGTLHVREFVTSTSVFDGDYMVNATGIGKTNYLADSADGYPVRQRN